MGGVRYIGSKARIVREIMELVGPPDSGDGFFIDAFCGTGVVGARAADLGWSVRLNDHLKSATALALAQLVTRQDVPFGALGGYEAAVEKLGESAPVEGFFWQQYSPGGSDRLYFTAENAARIDGVRQLVQSWTADERISEVERQLLVADLIGAAGRVANIAGTYGHFLSRLSATAKRPFQIQPRELRSETTIHEVYSVDVVDLPMAENDIAYFDPPYTKRQYAAYYHVNETLAYGDEPELSGKSGLRPWHEKASDYCYKRRALKALSDLIRNASARRIFLSYSSEGHVALDELEANIEALGEVTIHELSPVARYRPNQAASDARIEVTEYLVELEKIAEEGLESEFAEIV
jgi:adenine-specific DNA-methyltransferase